MTSAANQHGSALTATLAATAVLLPLAAFAVLLTRTDFYVHHNTRAQVEVFHVAEAGLEHALADIAPVVTLEGLLNGPDGKSGTADDGVFVFAEGPPGFFPREPLRYDVHVERVNANLVRLTSTAFGIRNARAVVEALVARDPEPYVPAALYAPGAHGLSISPNMLISGLDHVAGDPPNQPTSSAPAVPGMGVDDTATATVVRQQLAPAEAARVVGAGGTPSVAEVAAAAIVSLANGLAVTTGAVSVSAGALTAGAQLGSSDAPQITVLLNDADLTASVSGTGILVAPLGLRVRGALTFTGLMLVIGDVTTDVNSVMRVDGSMWVAGTDVQLLFAGHGAITYDRAAVSAIDQQFAGHLPHSVVVKSWREVI
jgi:hypothetical protein